MRDYLAAAAAARGERKQTKERRIISVASDESFEVLSRYRRASAHDRQFVLDYLRRVTVGRKGTAEATPRPPTTFP
jgi:hypothetical protein